MIEVSKYTFQFYLIAVSLLISFTSLSQEQFTLSGTITSAEDGSSMPGVQVVTEENLGTSSDVDGHYSLKLPAGEHSISFHMVGFQKMTEQVTLDADQHMNISLHAQAQLLDQVVISASRFEQNVAEVTVSMEVIGPQLIADRNITALDDALRETPGLIIVDEEPQIRSGSGYSFGAGSRVQVLLDGIPQLSGDVGRPAWANIPMESVDQIEVIKGASSVLYGSSALSGVVHVRSRYPGVQPETKIEAYGGGYAAPDKNSNNYWGGGNLIQGRTVMHSQQIGNSDLVVSLDLLSDDGHLGQMTDSLGVPIPVRGADDPGYFDAERRARGWIKFRHRNQKVPGLVYGLNLNGQKNASVATLLWDNTETGLFNALEGSATVTHQTISNVNPFIEYRSKAGHSVLYRGNWNSLDNANNNDQDNFSDSYFNEVQFQVNGDSAGIPGLNATIGLTYIFSESESQLFNNGGLEPKHESSNKGAYIQLDQEVHDRLHASMGLRWEEFIVDGESASQPVFRAGLNYRVGKASYFRASYGQGFRFPTIGERYISTAVGSLNIYPNPGLQAETSSNVEFGVKQGMAIGEFKGYMDIAFFQQEFKDFIEFTFGQWADSVTNDNFLGLGFTSLNTGRATVRGAELSIAATGKISKKSSLSILAGYTYTLPQTENPDYDYSPQRSDFEMDYRRSSSDPSNNILKYRMQHLARINLDLRSGRINLGFGMRYNSFMQNIDDIFEELDEGETLGGILPTGVTQWRKEKNKGDLVLDMRAGYDFYKEHRISVVVDNLLNREYAIRPLALESTRRILLRLSLSF